MQKKKLKKIIAVSGVVGTILSVKTIPANATEINAGISVAAITKGQVVNVSTTLRIRESASTSSTVLGTMRNGATFDIISKSGSWYKINYNGMSGYIHGDYVKEITSSSAVSSKGKVYNVSTNLRVRSGASASSSILGYVTNNTEVNIVGAEGEWYKIQYNSGYGYVHKDYILVNGTSNNNAGNSSSNGTESNTSTGSGNNNSGSNSDNVGSNNSSNNNSSTTESADVEVNKTGYVYNVITGLLVRKEPNTNCTVLGTLYSGNTVNIVGETGTWYKIKYNSTYAYVHKDYITENKPSSDANTNTGSAGNTNTGTSNGSSSNTNESASGTMQATGTIINVSTNLRVRKTPSTSGLVLGYVLNNQKVDVTGKEGNWYKIKFNGSVGYISADYVRILDGSSNDNNDSSASVSNAYNIVLEALKSQIGSPYAYGGSGELITAESIQSLKNRFPNDAAAGNYDGLNQYIGSGLRMFDCSGFMQWGFSKANINIGRSTYNQILSGVEVSLDNIQPGDLLFNKSLGHVGMYIGNGQWIESPNTGKTVRITDVPWSSIGRARRVL